MSRCFTQAVRCLSSTSRTPERGGGVAGHPHSPSRETITWRESASTLVRPVAGLGLATVSRFRLLAEHRSGVRFPTETTWVVSFGRNIKSSGSRRILCGVRYWPTLELWTGRACIGSFRFFRRWRCECLDGKRRKRGPLLGGESIWSIFVLVWNVRGIRTTNTRISC